MSAELDSPLAVPESKVAAPAKIQPDLSHPLRFGLRALMILIAVCGAQFALMSYLGILWGLVAGLAACFAVLGGLMVAAILFWRGAGTPVMHRLDQLAVRLVVAIPLLGIGSVLAGGGLAIHYQVTTWRTASKIQGELGFVARPQYIVERNHARWGLVVTSISQGKPFDQAGGQAGDVIICERGPEQFYEMLVENRGREVSLNVAAGAETQPLESCLARRLDVTVPR